MKILLLFIFSISLFAQNVDFSQLNNSTIPSFSGNKTLENKIKKAKNYNDLIKALESMPTGEYSLYLAIIYAKGIQKPDDFGNTIPKDIEKSKQYFHKSIELGYYNAAQILGALYLYNIDFIKEGNNIEKAEKYLKLALEHGLYEGTTSLAEIYFNYKNNIQEGMKYLELGAKHNISTAQLMLAIIYNWGYSDNKGNVIKKDPYAAQMLLTKACTNKKMTEMVKNFCFSKYVKKQTKGDNSNGYQK